MEQFPQQAPLCPMGHGFIASAREKAVEMPSASEISSIALMVGSMVLLFVIIELLYFESYKLGTRIQLPV